ncbi:MAG TPA: tetratricopeptide repeat protein [Bryobacteraceae bacterium]|nr:tetratricopeptide repeat protein [Bryobacteraceae bacterium]
MRVPVTILVMCAALAAQNLPPALSELFNKGVQAEKAGQLDAAEKAFLAVLEQGGKQAFIYNNLGIVYSERGNHEQALTQFREAVRLDANYAAPRVLIGNSLLALGRVKEAVMELEAAVKIDPREPSARLELAQAYNRAGNLTGAIEQFRQLRLQAPRNPEYAYRLGRAYMKLSASCIDEINRVAPDSARVYQILAENRMAQGSTGEAVRAYLKAAAADPRLPGIHLALAQIYVKEGNPGEARGEIEQELAIMPDNALALAFKQKLDGVRP